MTVANSTNCKWVTTPVMAKHLGIHYSTLLRLRRNERSPFREGHCYRRTGFSSQATLQWHLERTEAAFTSPILPQKIAAVENGDDKDVTLVRYRVVIEEAVVSLEQFEKYNRSCDEAGYYPDPDEFFECKFEDWQMGCPSMMFDVCDLVESEDGHGYVAFLGDVRSETDDVVSLTDPCLDWKHSNRDEIPLADNDYQGYWRKRAELNMSTPK